MNIKDSIQNILNKINNNEEFAVIFKFYKEEKGSIAYLPVGIVTGKLDADNLTFTSSNTVFSHLIKGPKDYGFAFSKTLTESVRNNRLIPKIIQEKQILKSLRNFYYIYARDQHRNPVVGVQSIDDTSSIDILYEEELLNYYIKKFPSAKEIIELLKKASGKLNLDINNISNILNNNYSNNKQANQILTAIWKHYHSDSSYNIFINGSEITPKKDIIRCICEQANIPYFYISSVERYEITDIEKVLKDLLERNNNNLEQAENTVLIIDNVDKLALTDLSTEAFANAQLNLAKILRGETIELKVGKYKKVLFDTSKMMIICMGNYSDDEINDIKICGFTSDKKAIKSNKEKYKYGMLDGLFDNFNMIIQMEDPCLQDYYNYLSNEANGGIIKNINFLNNLNIKLTLPEEVITELAKYAYDNKMSIPEVNELIERMLSMALFEIAKNPEEYEEIIISSEIIEDNKKYTLIRKGKQHEKK